MPRKSIDHIKIGTEVQIFYLGKIMTGKVVDKSTLRYQVKVGNDSRWIHPSMVLPKPSAHPTGTLSSSTEERAGERSRPRKVNPKSLVTLHLNIDNLLPTDYRFLSALVQLYCDPACVADLLALRSGTVSIRYHRDGRLELNPTTRTSDPPISIHHHD